MYAVKNTSQNVKINKKTQTSKTTLYQNFSDSQLYKKCKDYGRQSRIWKRKFAGTLPEVAKRELHKKRGYSSIYEFAGKLAGMTHEATHKILHIAGKLQDKPYLLKMLETGEQGWSKIEKVVWVATPQTEKEWAKRVKTMPRQALEVFVREHREREFKLKNAKIDQQNNLKGPLQNTQNQELVCNSTPGSKESQHLENIANEGFKEFKEDRWGTLAFSVSPEVESQLRLLKQAIEKERGLTLTWNEFMEEVVKKCKKNVLKNKKGNSIVHLNMELQKKKERPGENIGGDRDRSKDKNGTGSGDKSDDKNKNGGTSSQSSQNTQSTSRYIPLNIKREVLQKYDGKCAYPNCTHPPEIFHHIDGFAVNQKHNAELIVPICKPHERLAHTGEILNEEQESSTWETGNLELRKKKIEEGDKRYHIDTQVHMYRKE